MTSIPTVHETERQTPAAPALSQKHLALLAAGAGFSLSLIHI